jgi:hypothetical protein
MDRNHITICKFDSAQDSMFLKVFGRLHAAIGTKEQGEEQAQRIQRLLESVPALPTTE